MIFSIALTVLCASSRSYFSGRLRRRSISKVASCASQQQSASSTPPYTQRRTLRARLTAGRTNHSVLAEHEVGNLLCLKKCETHWAAQSKVCMARTSASSFPASFLYALVHLTFLGLRFILKFLWHLLRQKRNTCEASRHFLMTNPGAVRSSAVT